MHPFHLAFPVDNLQDARAFYGGLLGCPEGRSSDEWIDFNLFGHQIVAHLADGEAKNDVHSDVDGNEQATMFFLDPSGNAIEFKAMAHPDRLFAK
jgi:extradiol dioxygenase family protein